MTNNTHNKIACALLYFVVGLPLLSRLRLFNRWLFIGDSLIRISRKVLMPH